MLRTKETQRQYDAYLKEGGPLTFATDYALREFDYWKLIRNRFPYDAVALDHHLLIPKEPFAKFYDMPEEYITEFHGITNLLEMFYDFHGKNSPHKRTVSSWWHYHCINWRPNYRL